MKKDVKILSFETKQKKDGTDYLRVETSGGWTSVFDSDLGQAIQNSVGKTLNVEWTEKGNFKNITKLYGESPQLVTEEVKQSISDTDRSKAQSVYTSYAKDVFIALLERTPNDITEDNVMTEAVKLVIQAREAFK